MRNVFSAIVLSGLSFAPLVAADLTFADLRFSAGVLSNEFQGSSSTTVTNGGAAVSSSSSSNKGRDADNNYRGQIQFVSGHLGAGGGFVWGVGAAVNQASWDYGSQKAKATTPSVDILAGYGFAFTPQWHVELTPFVGAGRAYYSVTDKGSTNTSKEWNKYIEYGAKLGTYFALGNSFILGVEVPYLVGRFEPNYTHTENNGDKYTVTDDRRNRGFGLLLTIGGRF